MKIPNPLNGIKKIFRFKHKGAFVRNANKDWKRILETLGILSLIIIALEGYLFWGIDQGILFRSTILKENVTPTLDRASISKLSSFYQDRASTIEKLKASSTPVVDPSL